MIWLTSDLHLGHDREFIWKKRGFSSCEEMNECILDNLNDYVTPEDDLYILGDLTLGPHEAAMPLLKQLPGKVHIILGNHDTNARIEMYKQLPQVVEIALAAKFDYKKYHFYLSHYPTMTYNIDGADNLRTILINLHGHSHATKPFYMDIPYIYNIGIDAHNCAPISIDDVLLDIKEEWWLCKKMVDGEKESDIITISSANNEKPIKVSFEEPTINNLYESCDFEMQPFTPEKERRLLDNYYTKYCDKCVGCSHGMIPAPVIRKSIDETYWYVTCPSGDRYRRDPPDGGYYG